MRVFEKLKTHALPCAIIAAGLIHCLLYFNYFETPSEDFIGNIRPLAEAYIQGNLSGFNYKFLPFYPFVLAALSRINPFTSGDVIYSTAIALNLVLFIPYAIVVYIIFKRFLRGRALPAAMLFLMINTYTVFTAVNAELEMLLCLLVVLSMLHALRGLRISYLSAFFAALTKWDAAFTVPAAMFRDFFERKEKILSLILGTLATGGIAAWFAMSFMGTPGHMHPYVREIAERGPVHIRYLADCLLVLSGLIPWMAVDAFKSQGFLIRALSYPFIAAYGALLLGSLFWGFALLIRRHRRELAPVLVFLAGFIALHMIYQNTKERYVLPILWLLVLALFYGISEGLVPAFNNFIQRIKWRYRGVAGIALLLFLIVAYCASLLQLALAHRPPLLACALLFGGLALIIAVRRGSGSRITRVSCLLAAGVIINLMLFHGVAAMDHYSLRRVEFKKAALWFREHAGVGDKMLITEINVPKYYTGFGDERFVSAASLESKTIDALIPELRRRGVSYVFVDDFYIRRLAVGDKNAVDRKAFLFQHIREDESLRANFKPVASFETRGGIRSYLYRFVR